MPDSNIHVASNDTHGNSAITSNLYINDVKNDIKNVERNENDAIKPAAVQEEKEAVDQREYLAENNLIHQSVDQTVNQNVDQQIDQQIKQSAPRRYVGLTNSGATCYLNSLLQSLFCTPEFCQALFARCNDLQTISSSSSKIDRTFNIPYQLQLLFARLYLSRRPAVSTDSLTHAFRWDALDQWRQHDVQECLRVLFEALEVTMSRSQSLNASQTITPTIQSNSSIQSSKPVSVSFIRQLYSGQLVDCITCSKCNNQRSRYDEFLDLSLDISVATALTDHSISQQNDSITNQSMNLNDVLSRFIAPEDLGEHNTVFCSTCQAKTPSSKQLLISQLPPILTLQLKRFVYDPQSAGRSTKLNHRVEFPLELEMTPYLYQSISQTKCNQPNHQTNNHSDNMYDLFSVLLHSGTMSNGHYQSINQISDGNFYLFNDSCVEPIESLDKLFDCSFGGSQSNSSAYVLVYRSRQLRNNQPINQTIKQSIAQTAGQSVSDTDSPPQTLRTPLSSNQPIDQPTNQHLSMSSSLPHEMSAIVQEEDEEYFKKQQELEFERRAREIDIYCCNNQAINQTDDPLSVKLDGDTTVAALTDLAREHFSSISELPADGIRLRLFDPKLNWHKQPLIDESTNQSIDSTLSECDMPKRSCLIVETRSSDQSWPVYSSSHIPLRFLTINEPMYQSVIETSATLHQHSDVCNRLIDSTSITWKDDIDTQQFIEYNLLHLHGDRCKVLDTSMQLQSQDVMPGDAILIEPITSLDALPGSSCASDSTQAASQSPFCVAFDNVKNSIRILFNLPNVHQLDTDVQGSNVSPPDSSSSITINKHCSIDQLKFQLSSLLGLPVEAFTLSRSSATAAWNDVAQSLDQAGLVDCSAVHVRIEPQLQAHQIKVDVYQLVQPNNQFTLLCSLIHPKSDNIGRVRDAITDMLPTLDSINRSTNQSINQSTSAFLIRDKKANLSNRFLDQSTTLEALTVGGASQLQICIQFVDSIDQSISQSSLTIVRFQQLQGRALTGDMHEIMLPKSATIAIVKQQILSKLAKPSTNQSSESSVNQPVEIVSLTKGLSTRRMLKADIDRLSFLSLTPTVESKLARNPPLSLRSGDLLVVKTRITKSKDSVDACVSAATGDAIEGTTVIEESKQQESSSSTSLTKPWSSRRRVAAKSGVNRFAKRAATLLKDVDVLAKGRPMRNDFYISIDDEIAAIEAAYAQTQLNDNASPDTAIKQSTLNVDTNQSCISDEHKD